MGAMCFYRPCFIPADDGEGDCGDGALWGQRVIDQITANGHHWPDYLSFRNEMNPTSGNAQQYQRYRAALRAAGYTGLVVYGSFGNGRPDWPEYATIPADADALELHEYWTGTVAASPDLALRHVEAIKRGLLPATMPLILGEIGEWTAGHGWRSDVTADQMVAQLAIYRAGCAPSVVVTFLFADGDNGDQQWQSFTTRNTPVEDAIRATWPKTPPQSSQDGATIPKGVPVASLPIPLDNQLTSDGPNKYNECGPAGIRMVCDYLGIDPGESIDAIDTDETGDESLIGYTTTNQMVDWFTARGVPAVQAQPLDTAAAIAGNLAKGWPCIYLGVWDRAAMTGGHFEVPVADTGTGIVFNNPYGAFTETLSYADVNRYSLGWLVTIQEAKEATMDPALQAAAVARFSALGIKPNVDGAIFKQYARMVDRWLQSARDNLADPTPAVKPEWSNGQIARVPLDNGVILEWHAKDGLCYQVEVKDRDATYKACGWS